jgi:sodium-coupled neutral amino acid transporter 11
MIPSSIEYSVTDLYPIECKEPDSQLDGGNASINASPFSGDSGHFEHMELTITAYNKKNKVGLLLSVWNLINDIMTPATIAVAHYVAQCGLMMALGLLLLFSVVTIYTLCLLFDLSKEHKKKSLPELCAKAFGKPGYFMVAFFIFTFNFGGVLISILMLGDLMTSIIQQQFGIYHFLLGRTAIMCYLTAFMLPINFRKQLTNFALTSLISFATLFIIGILVMYRALINRAQVPNLTSNIVMVSSDAIFALGGLSYTFVCHDLSFNVFCELRRATKQRYYSVVYITIGLTIIVLFLIGVGGYLLFGERALEVDVLLSLFPKDDNLGLFCKLLFTIDLFLSVPFQLFMPRLGLTHMATLLYPSIATNQKKSEIFFYGSTIVVTIIALMISLIVNDLGIIFELCGGVSACALAYIIPPLLALKFKSCSRIRKIICIIILCMGFTVLVCSFTASFSRFL